MEFDFKETLNKLYERDKQSLSDKIMDIKNSNPDVSSEAAIATVINLTMQFSLDLSNSVLEEYHVKLMEYLKSEK